MVKCYRVPALRYGVEQSNGLKQLRLERKCDRFRIVVDAHGLKLDRGKQSRIG